MLFLASFQATHALKTLGLFAWFFSLVLIEIYTFCVCFLAWFQATQALETLGLFAGFFSLVFLVLFIFHAQSSTNKTIFVMGMISTLVAGMLYLFIVL